MKAEQVLKRPIILSEKAALEKEELNKFYFEVDRGATKLDIKAAVEELFQVKVLDVNTLIMRGKMRRMGRGHAKTKNWKKAIVTLPEGETIDFFEGA